MLLIEEGGRGGVADYTLALAGGLRAAGCDVVLATARDHHHDVPPSVAVRRPYAYVRHPLARRLRLSRPANGLLHAAAAAPLARLARQADVVHLQGAGEWRPLTALTARLLRAAGRPLVWTPHNTFERLAGQDRSWAALYALADRVVVHAAADLPEVPSAARPRTVVLPMGHFGAFAGAQAADAGAARAALGLPPEALVVLLFGVLRPDKGLADLLRAACEVPEVHVLAAGEDHGGLRDARPLLDHPRLRGRVVLREGWVATGDLAGLVGASDLVAAPYARASQSAVLLLAYGAGRPVIAYPVGGLPEVVEHARTGWVAARADPEALAAALREAVAAGREGLAAMGAAARTMAEERFSWEAIGHRTAALYEDVLGERRGLP